MLVCCLNTDYLLEKIICKIFKSYYLFYRHIAVVTFSINGEKAFCDTDEAVMFTKFYITKMDINSFYILDSKDKIVK